EFRRVLFRSSVALGQAAMATGAESVAIGGSSFLGFFPTEASGDYSTAVGAGAWATGTNATALGNFSTATGENSTALGAGSIAEADNSVALGVGSEADREDSVSVGAAGAERQVTNVAAGTEGTDAVNLEQLEDATASSRYFQATGNDDDPSDDVGAYAEGGYATASGEAANAYGQGASA